MPFRRAQAAANTVVMKRTVHMGAFLLVEGEDDKKLLRPRAGFSEIAGMGFHGGCSGV